MTPLNGHKKIVALMSVAVGLCSILAFVSGTYAGWRQKVSESVTMQRMVNANDETLRAILPKVEICHEVNALQQSRLEFADWRNDDQDKRIEAMARSVERFGDLMQLYLQSGMKRGEVAR